MKKLVALFFLLTACSQGAKFNTVEIDKVTPDDLTGDQISETEFPSEIIRMPTPTSFPRITAPQIRRPAFLSRIPDFEQSIPFDGIFPVYDPQFVNGVDAQLQPDELIIGIVKGGEAKAYPVTVLRFREMVNDELGGDPILVTW